MITNQHYNLPPTTCELGDRLFKTSNKCMIPYNSKDPRNQDLGACQDWSTIIPGFRYPERNPDYYQMCNPSCTKERQNCPPAPVTDPTTGFSLQGKSRCSINPDEWEGHGLPDGYLGNCFITTPIVTGDDFNICRTETDPNLKRNCNACMHDLHASLIGEKNGDELLSVLGSEGQTKRREHMAQILAEWAYGVPSCANHPSLQTWIDKYIDGPEQGGIDPILRARTIWNNMNSDIRLAERCVRTPDNPQLDACKGIICNNFNNDPRSNNYCETASVQPTGEKCCRLAILGGSNPHLQLEYAPTGWSDLPPQ